MKSLIAGLTCAVLASGCSTALCDAARCPNGCCDAAGLCQLGTTREACAPGGQSCVACAAKEGCSTARSCVTLGKPTLMFLIDVSGSMSFPVDPTASACPAGCTTACPASCPTRMAAMKQAISSFTSTSGTAAWMGLAVFPSRQFNDVCGSTASADVRTVAPVESDPSTEMQAQANGVNAEVQTLTNGGGTPTASSLRTLTLSSAGLQSSNRANHVVLITDGAPNCNDSNPNTCSTSACRCTLGTASSCAGIFCAKGCLDQDNAVKAAGELKAKGIKTIVVGLGPETATGDGSAAMEAIAEAGGYSVGTCPNGTNAECGAGATCVSTTKVCKKRYQAGSASELGLALQDIAKNLSP